MKPNLFEQFLGAWMVEVFALSFDMAIKFGELMFAMQGGDSR